MDLGFIFSCSFSSVGITLNGVAVVAGIKVSVACRESGFSATLGIGGSSGVALLNLALSSWAFVVSRLILRLLFFSFSISKRVSGDDTGRECFLEVPASDLPAVFVEVFFVLDFLGQAQVDSCRVECVNRFD